MTVTMLDAVLWAAGFLLSVALTAVLVYKRRYRTLPWFTAFIAAGCVYTPTLFLVSRFGSLRAYAAVYLICETLDLLLQVSVIVEVARLVLQRSGRWVEGARLRLMLMGVSAPLIALTMALLMKPFATSRTDAFFTRASLFTTVLVFVLFIAVVAASHQLGLGWRSYPVRVGAGLAAWVSSGFLSDTLHAYWRTVGHTALLEDIHNVTFQLVTLLWCIAFWRPERAAVALGEREKLRLETLRRGLEYGQR